MCLKITVGGHGASTTIEVLEYERTCTENEYDANWLKCRVTINATELNGSYCASFTTHDFVRFRDELRSCLAALKGLACFKTIEGALERQIEMTRTGGALIRTVAKVRGSVAITMSISYESDQSFLAETLNELGAI